MYRILLVDDDKVILEAMKSTLERDFMVVGTASNGREALGILGQREADIVITDISMPVMNGLELIAELRTLHPRIKVIALSNYDDFILIKEAMRLGAVDYLRKHEVNEGALSVLLTELPQLDRIAYRIGVDKVKGIEKRQMWISALQGTLEGDERAAMAAQYQEDRYVPVALRFREPISPMLLRKLRVQMESVKFSEWIQLDERTWIQLAAVDTNSRQAFANLWTQVLIRLSAQLNEWRQFVQYFALYHDCACGGERLVANLRKIGLRLDGAFYEGYGRFVSLRNCPVIEGDDGAFFVDWGRRLVAHCKLDHDLLPQLLDEFLGAAASRRFEPDSLRRGGALILRQMLVALGRSGEGERLAKDVEQAATFQEFKSLMCDTALAAVRASRPMRTDIAGALDYIHKHYTEDIPLEKVARVSNMSRNHFCTLFKKETGYTFVEYVNRYRIERAKQLLMTSTLRTYEIAYQIGIPDYRYFCRLFHRYTQKQPSDYRYSLIGSEMIPKEGER